jgi:CheY-like chemotaxis protein
MPRILVLDDEPLIGIVVEEWLAELGLETAGPVGTAREALELIDGGHLDAAILDVTLADGDSYAVAELLRARSIPFAFVTGGRASPIEDRFRDVPTLSKPFEFDAMRAVLKKLIVF